MDYVVVGKIVNTRGLKGDLKVVSFSSFNEERFKKGNKLFIDFNGEIIEVEVNKSSHDPKFIYVSFKGLEDINLVEKYKGCELKFPVDKLPELEEDNYYYRDLIGCEVYQEEKFVGKVLSVEESNNISMLRIKSDTSKNDVLVLFMKQFVKAVDLDNKKIYLNVVEGLL